MKTNVSFVYVALHLGTAGTVTWERFAKTHKEIRTWIETQEYPSSYMIIDGHVFDFAPHKFEGRTDRDCEVCHRPDRAPVHHEATE